MNEDDEKQQQRKDISHEKEILLVESLHNTATLLERHYRGTDEEGQARSSISITPKDLRDRLLDTWRSLALFAGDIVDNHRNPDEPNPPRQPAPPPLSELLEKEYEELAEQSPEVKRLPPIAE